MKRAKINQSLKHSLKESTGFNEVYSLRKAKKNTMHVPPTHGHEENCLVFGENSSQAHPIAWVELTGGGSLLKGTATFYHFF